MLNLALPKMCYFSIADVLVTCYPRDKIVIKFVQFSCLIAFVFSPSTEGYNRSAKFTQYRRLESLRIYLVISADERSRARSASY